MPPQADALAIAHALADAAFAAWQGVAHQSDRHSKVGMGAGGNLTSRADDALEQAILEAAKAYPVAVLSEEAGLITRPGAKWLAVVDPLDGSRNAGRGIPFHCTSVALAPLGGSLRTLEAGVVRNLVTGDTYAAAKGRGATVNGVPVQPTAFDPDEVLVGIIADYSESEIQDAHAKPDHHIRDLGSAALEMCLVGTGALDAFVVRRPWLRVLDIAAAALFVREAGGLVLDPVTGAELDVALTMEVRSGVLAAHNPEARRAVSGTRITPSRATGTTKAPGHGAEGSLTWALVGKAGIPHVRKEALWIRDHLLARGQRVLLETDLAQASGEPGRTLEALDREADLFVTVGGDGTILMTQHVTDKPVFGVNAGAIGFLAEVEPPQAAAAIDQIVKGDYRVEERDKLSSWLGAQRLPDATNEVTLQTSRIAKLIRFRVTVAGEVLDTLRGDGIIVSTATGSTGYSMSVGGPLVHPLVHGTVLAPIAPFRLSARPWVIPSDAVVELLLEDRDSQSGTGQARVVVDGQHGFEVSPGQTVRIAPSPRKARFIRLGSGYYERVRSKLTR
ncbi:MAG TPA: inositol monophosphatase family protein [Candidatus Thermoplasmatota archaeon]|nr:inositol monophosphatase family protein [Candidatus Thermoplasmatota archaeon]